VRTLGSEKVVGLFEAFAFKPVDAEDGFVPIQKVPVPSLFPMIQTPQLTE